MSTFRHQRDRLRRAHGPRADRGAFTLAELIIGLLVLAFVGGATAAVASALSRGWQLGESSAASTLTITRTMLRIQHKVQRAALLGQWHPGSIDPLPGNAQGAALFFWRGDANGDGQMQLAETEILEHDPNTRSLLVWETSFPDALTEHQHNQVFPTTMLNEPFAIQSYKTMPHTKRRVITRNVTAAAFAVITPTAATSRAQFEWRLRFAGPSGDTVEYGTASQRAPQ